MAKRTVNATNVIKLAGTTTVLSLGVGATGSYFLSHLYPRYDISTGGCMLLAWLVPHTWILLAAVDSLREELGFKSPLRIISNSSRRTFGRRIPVSSGDEQKNIFMKTLSLAPGIAEEINLPSEIDTISIWYDGNEHILTLPEIEEFVYSTWRRQRQKKNGLSRDYWTKQRRPRLKTLEYNLRIWTLVFCGLIIGRSEGRSGRLSVPPNEAIKIIRSRL